MEKDKMNDVYRDFKATVHMYASELKKWLGTDESKSVGWDSGDGESVGHKSGEKIISILEKEKDELTAEDYEHMQKVNAYAKRHRAQRPNDPKNSTWEYSLRNWGQDYGK